MKNKPLYFDNYLNKKPNLIFVKALWGVVYFLFFLFIGIYLFINIKYYQASVIGPSMQNTLNATGEHNSDWVYVNQYSTIKYGDIIVANHNGKEVIKRVIGLSGDKIRYSYNSTTKVCELYVNGEKIIESYLKENVTENCNQLSKILPGGDNYVEGTCVLNNNGTSYVFDDYYEYVVPQNCVFYMGDNRKNSEDCRVYGAISLEYVKGRVDIVIPYGTTKLTYWFNYFFKI